MSASFRPRPGWVLALFFICLGCETPKPPPVFTPEPDVETSLKNNREVHLANLRQLTFKGENAEAYWSFDGKQLIYQAHSGEGCDQIYRMAVTNPTDPELVSTGNGATTCAYFLPNNEEIIYASTHLKSPDCPPKPDHSQGYVWALYESYDIFKSKADGTELVRLTDTPGYDAEGTVCAKDGSIVFTSVRDGDIELYRMDADGKNVQRLTEQPGYDGGAFFNADCSKIVWRASRPTGKDLEDYQRLLAQGLVRPSKLELYVANADGSEARQITYLDAASFAPYWHPSGTRIVFSSNYGDPKGREFDLWAIDEDGTDLERITFTPGFDGFPMFSPDGKTLAFASNRVTPPGAHDTNVFLADWIESEPRTEHTTAADRIMSDIEWLADPKREGRGVGTQGLLAAGTYLAERFKQLGLEPLPGLHDYRDEFKVTTEVKVGEKTRLSIGNKALSNDDYQPLAFAAEGEARGNLVLANYGIQDAELGVDDYKGIDAKNKIVVVRRFVPDSAAFEETKNKRRFGDLRYKAWVARERGALGMIVVDAPLPPEKKDDAAEKWEPPSEAKFPSLDVRAYGNAGIPVAIVKRAAFAETLRRLERRQRVRAELVVALNFKKESTFNVVGRLPANAPEAQRASGAIVIGAHYDHLGYGGFNSLAPDSTEPHVGADDNASGVAVVLEVARALSQAQDRHHDVIFIAFSAEEMGLLGASHFTKEPPKGFALGDVYAMLNLDMVGRLRDNRLTILGAKTATEWPKLLDAACDKSRIQCSSSGDGYGPSDQTAFYAAGIPVLHFFSGAHSDYHKPSDTAERINAAGAGQIALLVGNVVSAASKLEQKLSYQKLEAQVPAGDLRSFNASLGTIPDYAGPKDGVGVLLAGVRPGGAAEQAGLQRGDILIRLGTHDIKSVHDLMFALNNSKPGQTVTAVVIRKGAEHKTQVTFQERKSRRP